MTNLLNYNEKGHAFKAVFFGGPKVGKTLLMGQLARDFNLLWMDLENGVVTLLHNLPKDYLKNIEHILLRDTPSNTCADATLLHMFENKAPGTICEEHGVWDCSVCLLKKAPRTPIDMNKMTAADGWVICIDSGSQFALSAFNHICNKNKISLADGDSAAFTIWGEQGAHIDKLFSFIQNGKWNVALAAHEIEVEMPDKSKKIVPSVGTRKVASNFSKYFDHNIRLSISGGKYKIACLPSQSVVADVGTRYNIDITKPGAHVCDLFKLPAGVQAGITTTVVQTPAIGGSGSSLSKYLSPKKP